MRYCYEKPDHYQIHRGMVYFCDHPVYNRCTLFTQDEKGLAVIQQRYISEQKYTYWAEIDPWLVGEVLKHPRFQSYFDSKASEPGNGLYPTVTVRQLMWALRMKPLRKEPWETVFDHGYI